MRTLARFFGMVWVLVLIAVGFFAVLAAAESSEPATDGESSFQASATPAASGAPTTSSQTPAATAAPETPSGDAVCLGDPAAIEDLRHRREEMELRQKALDARDGELKARERAIDDELKKLEQLRDDVAKIDEAHRQANQEKVAKLVETFQTMSPKAASALLASLDEALAVATIEQMDTTRLAKVLNVMEPAKSARLTEILAGVVRARNIASYVKTSDAAAKPSTETTMASAKGGDNNDGQNQ